MSKYVKEIKKYAFSSELIKGKAYHIITGDTEFDAIYKCLDDNGNAMFAYVNNRSIDWFTVEAEDVANGNVKIIELIQPFSSIYKIEKPHLDPEYVRNMLNEIEVKNNECQSLLTIDNIINQAINNLEEAHIHEEDLDKAYKDEYGIIHQPSVTEKESFFIETDPNVHPV
jgi:hypothetical protein